MRTLEAIPKSKNMASVAQKKPNLSPVSIPKKQDNWVSENGYFPPDKFILDTSSESPGSISSASPVFSPGRIATQMVAQATASALQNIASIVHNRSAPTRPPPIYIPLVKRTIIPAPSSADLPEKSESKVIFSNVDKIHEFAVQTPLPSPKPFLVPEVPAEEEVKVYMQAKGYIPDSPDGNA